MRYSVLIVIAACVALATDVWLRFVVLPLSRDDEVKRVAWFGRVMRAWARALFFLAHRGMGMRLTVEGPVPQAGRYLVVANHQSSFDVPLLITLLDKLELKFVAMEELSHGQPAISLMVRHGGIATVGQKDMGQDLGAIVRFAEGLERFGASPMIFPAGGVQRDDPAPRFFFAGIDLIRRGSRLPLLPIAIEGWHTVPSVGSAMRLYHGQLTVRISEPISFEDAERDPRATYEWVEKKIYSDVAELRARHARGGGAVPSPDYS